MSNITKLDKKIAQYNALKSRITEKNAELSWLREQIADQLVILGGSYNGVTAYRVGECTVREHKRRAYDVIHFGTQR